MAKKVSKGKEKKLLRKAEQEKAQQLRSFLNNLNKEADLLQSYTAFKNYDRNGLLASLQCFKGNDLPTGVLDWAFHLTKLHMQALYHACPSWGWSDASKRDELAHPNARIVCVFQTPSASSPPASSVAVPANQAAMASSDADATQGGTLPCSSGHKTQGSQQSGASSAEGEAHTSPVAFMHFRFEEEAGEAVLYLYDIQIEHQAQGKGLGKFLMQLLELMGRKSGVARLMLTVFHGNTAARALYRKLGYTLDEDSPTAVDPTSDATYDILTKWLTPRKKTS